MAKVFLEHLPFLKRGILPKRPREDQSCCICLQDFGTQPSANGVIERPVLLPCDVSLEICLTFFTLTFIVWLVTCLEVFEFRRPSEVH